MCVIPVTISVVGDCTYIQAVSNQTKSTVKAGAETDLDEPSRHEKRE
jgi:hypothetical protein